MKEPTTQNLESKRDWSLTAGAFQRLLDWLDEGADSGGQRYLEMRRRLVLYFDRKNCLAPDDLADETLTRVARRLEEEGTITSDAPAHYCYIVARFVFLESLRAKGRETALNETWAQVVVQPETGREDEEAERRLECLDRCMRNLEAHHRQLILNYYADEERARRDHRREMADRLGITMNALSIRAFRLREKLEACVRRCMSQGR